MEFCKATEPPLNAKASRKLTLGAIGHRNGVPTRGR
jgi:hypothetical protein